MNQKNPNWFELPVERWRNHPDSYHLEKDSQRQKLYDAEVTARYKICNELGMVPIISFSSIEEIQKFVNRLVFSTWFKKRWPHFTYMLGVEVKELKKGYAYARRNSIHLHKRAWNTVVVLHEIAHCIKRFGAGGSHGRYFARSFLELVNHVVGNKAMKILKEEFKRHRVKYTPKRQLSNEVRKVYRENFVQNVLNGEKKDDRLCIYG